VTSPGVVDVVVVVVRIPTVRPKTRALRKIGTDVPVTVVVSTSPPVVVLAAAADAPKSKG
jgi:hypothetical protein